MLPDAVRLLEDFLADINFLNGLLSEDILPVDQYERISDPLCPLSNKAKLLVRFLSQTPLGSYDRFCEMLCGVSGGIHLFHRMEHELHKSKPASLSKQN